MRATWLAASITRITRPSLLRCFQYSRPMHEYPSMRPPTSSAESISPFMLYVEPPPTLDPGQSNQTLVDLVKEGKFAAADRLRLQMEEEGTEIKHHQIFESAAVATLAFLKDPDLLSRFSSWFCLIPDRHHVKTAAGGPLLLINSRRALFKTALVAENLPLLMDFGLICAAKGHLEHVFPSVARQVVKLMNPAGGVKYLLHLETTATQYQELYQAEEAWKVTTRYLRDIMEICAQAGWENEAVEILRKNQYICFPQETYRLLLSKTEGTDLRAEVKKFWEKQLFRRTLSVSAPPPRKVILPLSESAIKYSAELPPSIPLSINTTMRHPSRLAFADRPPPLQISPAGKGRRTDHAPATRSEVAKYLKTLKEAIREQKQIPNTELSRIFEDYRSVSPKWRALPILRKRVINNGSMQARTEWLTAELRMRHQYHQLENVLDICADYVDVSPMPRAFRDTLARLVRRPVSGKAVAGQDKTKVWKFSSGFGWVMQSIIRLELKRLPSPLETTQALYASFLSTNNTTAGAVFLFSEFVRGFSYCSRPDLAEAVVDEEKKRGIVVDEKQYAMLAGAYARAGNVVRAMAFLACVENEGKELASLVTYSRILKGLVDAGLVNGAEELVKERNVGARARTIKIFRELEHKVLVEGSLEPVVPPTDERNVVLE